MKRKIVIGLSVILLIFFVGALFIVYTLRTTRSRFDRLIHLHQVQIIRDDLMFNLQKTQAGIYLRGTRFAKGDNSVKSDAAALETAIQNCFTCHHSRAIHGKLVDARDMIHAYRMRIDEILVNEGAEIAMKEDEAIAVGNKLFDMFGELISFANIHLQARTVRVSQYVDVVEQSLYLIMIVGFLVAAFIAVRLMRQMTKPVEELLKGAEKFSLGNLDHRISEEMPKEFSLVAASFNKMAGELKENIKKIKKTEQIEIMREIAAGLAHEIKNPLTGIRGALEVFMHDLDLSAEDRAVFQEMLFQVKKLDVMTKCFLEYARPPSPQLVQTNVNDITRNTIAFVVRQNLHKNLEKVNIVEELDHSMPVIHADPIQVQQVLMNLIFNALDAMPEGGNLVFRTSYQGGRAEIEVSDSGHGIDKAAIDNIFKPFFTTKSKGLGIGLSICKRLVEQHGGEISAESNESGTTFKVSLPTARFAEKMTQELR